MWHCIPRVRLEPPSFTSQRAINSGSEVMSRIYSQIVGLALLGMLPHLARAQQIYGPRQPISRVGDVSRVDFFVAPDVNGDGRADVAMSGDSLTAVLRGEQWERLDADVVEERSHPDVDARIAAALMSIQAIKGVEIGLGFGVASRPGSRVHDEIDFDFSTNPPTYRTNDEETFEDVIEWFGL
mgnify:CR=1 FL=1